MNERNKPTVGTLGFLIPLVVGCGSGPFVFKGLGLGELAWSNPLISWLAICYIVGAFVIVRGLMGLLSSFFARTKGTGD